ncbi:MAG: hypothetical protein WCD79_23690 [Chthoniobacteraceae bacterium]
MNEVIELHDSDLAAVEFANETAILSLRPAYIHRSEGRPGIDAGSGWIQDATLTIFAAESVVPPSRLPATIWDGFFRVGNHTYDNTIPVAASFDGAIELHIVLNSSETVTIRGERIEIALMGRARYVEEFPRN